MNINRRSFTRAIAWSAPAIVIAKESPAFATSNTECEIVGWYKAPGKGKATKDYYVLVSCCDEEVESVTIYDDVADIHREATQQRDLSWAAFGFNDSRRNRLVTVNSTFQKVVSFSPKKK